MKHVMVDLETLGTVPGCVILSIGAVEFDPASGTLGKEFYVVVNRESCEAAYLLVDPETVAWWGRQGEQAREVLKLAAGRKSSVPLKLALAKFNDWLGTVGTQKEVVVYGNGADFDNPILACAYSAVKMKQGWASYNGRCYRTLKNLHELFGEAFRAPKLARTGTYHNALDDAKSQALHLIDVVQRIMKGVK